MAYTAKQLAEQIAANEAAGIGEGTPQPGYENMPDRYPTKEEPSLGRKALRAFDMGDATGGRMPVHAVNVLLDKLKGSGDRATADTSGDAEWEAERLRKLKEEEGTQPTGDGKNVSRETKGKGLDLSGVKDFMTSPGGLLALMTVGRAIAGNEATAQGNDTPIFDYARGLGGFLKGKNDADEQARKEALERDKIDADKLKAVKPGRDLEQQWFQQIHNTVTGKPDFTSDVKRSMTAADVVNANFPGTSLSDQEIKDNSKALVVLGETPQSLRAYWEAAYPQTAQLLAKRASGVKTTSDTANAGTTKPPATTLKPYTGPTPRTEADKKALRAMGFNV